MSPGSGLRHWGAWSGLVAAAVLSQAVQTAHAADADYGGQDCRVVTGSCTSTAFSVQRSGTYAHELQVYIWNHKPGVEWRVYDVANGVNVGSGRLPIETCGLSAEIHGLYGTYRLQIWDATDGDYAWVGPHHPDSHPWSTASCTPPRYPL